MVSHMRVKQNLFGKFQKQFNKQMTLLLKNTEHKHHRLVVKHQADILANSYKFFVVIFNLQLAEFLQESVIRIMVKAPLEAQVKNISETNFMDKVLDITSNISKLDIMEVLIKRKDPVFMAANMVIVKRAFFGATIANYAKYRLENIRTFQKVRKSTWQMDFCKQIIDAINKFTTATDQSIIGIDEVKFDKSDTGKMKVPSLRHLNRTAGTVLSREEQYIISRMKNIRSIAELADSLKRRRKFSMNLKSDFLALFIVEMAHYFAGL